MSEIKEMVEFLEGQIAEKTYLLDSALLFDRVAMKEELIILTEIKKELEKKHSYSDGYMQGKIDSDKLWVKSRILLNKAGDE